MDIETFLDALKLKVSEYLNDLVKDQEKLPKTFFKVICEVLALAECTDVDTLKKNLSLMTIENLKTFMTKYTLSKASILENYNERIHGINSPCNDNIDGRDTQLMFRVSNGVNDERRNENLYGIKKGKPYNYIIELKNDSIQIAIREVTTFLELSEKHAVMAINSDAIYSSGEIKFDENELIFNTNCSLTGGLGLESSDYSEFDFYENFNNKIKQIFFEILSIDNTPADVEKVTYSDNGLFPWYGKDKTPICNLSVKDVKNKLFETVSYKKKKPSSTVCFDPPISYKNEKMPTGFLVLDNSDGNWKCNDNVFELIKKLAIEIEPITYAEMKQFFDLNIADLTKFHNSKGLEKPVRIAYDEYKEKQDRCLTAKDPITNAIFKLIDIINPQIISLEKLRYHINICYNKLINKMKDIVISNSNTVFYFNLGSDLSKSNFWLSLMFVYELEKHTQKSRLQDKIFFSELFLTENSKTKLYYMIKHDPNKNNVFVYLDDCSYSGTQMYTTLTGDATYFSKFNRSGKKNIIVAMPFMSAHAEKKLSFVDPAIIFVTSVILPNLFTDKEKFRAILKNNLYILTLADEEKINGYIKEGIIEFVEDLRDEFEVTDLLTTVMGIRMVRMITSIFEHKIADSFSVPQYLYNFIPTYSPNKKYFLIRLDKEKVNDIVAEFNNENINNIKDLENQEKKMEVLTTIGNNIRDNFIEYWKRLKSGNDTADSYINGFEVITLEGIPNNKENCGRSVGLLKNCLESHEKYKEEEGLVPFGVDYESGEQCYDSLYKNATYMVTESMKQLWLKKLVLDDNKKIINKYKVVPEGTKGSRGGSKNIYFSYYKENKNMYLNLLRLK